MSCIVPFSYNKLFLGKVRFEVANKRGKENSDTDFSISTT